MSFSDSSPTYYLQFTDGSVLTLLNVGSSAPTYSGEYELVIPNLYFGTFLGDRIRSVKYDGNGNEYIFDNDTITINGTNTYTLTHGRGVMGYDPDLDQIKIIDVDTGHTIPYLHKTNFEIDGIVYQRDTSGTQFDSFGEALAYGQNIYQNPPAGFGAWYGLENVTSMSIIAPFYGTIVYCGIQSTLQHTVLDSLFDTGWGSAGYLNLDLSGILDDYDPEAPEPPDDDPYNEGGNSGEGGGDGDFDDTGDDIPIPPVPTISASDTGFITLFNPSLSQLKNLSTYMWSNLFDVDIFKKLFADPMDCIIGLSIVPVNVPSGGTRAVVVGNVNTGVTMTVAGSQYIEVNCGSVNVTEYWGAYLDYDPYTKVEIYLPYIGIMPLSTDDVMKKTIEVVYHVDILSGACTAYIKCGSSVLYQYIGQCSSCIPFTSQSWTNVINGCLQIAGSLGHMAATGGTSAGLDLASVASTAVNSLKPSIDKSGSASGTGGLMAIQKPFLVLTRPRQAVPSSQNHFTGYPSFITELFASLSGYTEVEEVHLTGIPATDAEMIEIEALLKKGVLF